MFLLVILRRKNRCVLLAKRIVNLSRIKHIFTFSRTICSMYFKARKTQKCSYYENTNKIFSVENENVQFKSIQNDRNLRVSCEIKIKLP